jgi:hypothetical protein
MELVFSKGFLKFLFGFIFIIIFGLVGVTISNRYFGDKETMVANPSESR